MRMNKAEVLKEIQRTTEANGGKPLGSRRFETETGIKQRDWQGKFWARWSDALREAGFAPNEMKSAYPTPYLLERYSQLARELGRLPTANDIRLKCRQESSFPDLKVFERLGSKVKLVNQLVDWCRSSPANQDVLGMCDRYVPRFRDENDRGKQGKSEFGFVYLIKSGKFYKIGRSNSVGRREYEIGLQLPETSKRIHAIRTDDPVGIEGYWHRRFGEKRGNGEWFNLDADDVLAFKRRKFM